METSGSEHELTRSMERAQFVGDVLEAMVKYRVAVGDFVVFSWSFPNEFFSFFSDYQVWMALSSLSWPYQTERLLTSLCCCFRGMVTVGRMDIVVDSLTVTP